MGLAITRERFDEVDYTRFEERLASSLLALEQLLHRLLLQGLVERFVALLLLLEDRLPALGDVGQIGRASCRERV